MPLDEELSICVEPLPYHRRLVEHFQKSEKELWKWICSPEQQQNIDAESFRLELLKSTYRLDEQSHPVLFQTIDELRKLMRIDAAVFVYQSQGTGGVNASLAFLPGEAHIILMGPVLTLVTPDELMALLAHELGHYLFLSQQNGEYLHASELIRSLSNDVVAGIEHVETARLWNLYTELFCDRWAFAVSKDLGVAVRTLVKAQTGLSDVNAESYLRQAAEIFASGPIKAGAKEFTHPELYIRARALELWSQQGNDSQSDIESLIEGKLDLQQLDMLSQHTASEFTVALLDEILRPKWRRTEANLAHARQFFPDIESRTIPEMDVAAILDRADDSVRDYACYVLLDFATVDREQSDAGIAASLIHSKAWGIYDRFAELVQKELGLAKKAWSRISKDPEALVDQAAQVHTKVMSE